VAQDVLVLYLEAQTNQHARNAQKDNGARCQLQLQKQLVNSVPEADTAKDQEQQTTARVILVPQENGAVYALQLVQMSVKIVRKEGTVQLRLRH
jgi:hypothetical protein